MATRKWGRTRASALAEGAEPETSAAATLDKLEADTATEASPDPDAAAAKLGGATAAEPDTTDADGEPEEPRRGRRGPRKGTKYRPRRKRPATDADDATPPRRSRERLADVQAERDELRAKVDALGPDPEAAVQQLSDSISGAVQVMGEVLSDNGAPAWKFSAAQGEQLGRIWAPVLAPYLPTVGAAAPLTMAVLQTGLILLPNWRKHRELSAQDGDTKEVARVEGPKPDGAQ